MRLKDKVAIVTGGSSGIGQATVFRFAKEGAKVIIVDKDDSSTTATLIQTMKSRGHAYGYSADISVEDNVKYVVSRVMEDYGRIDILINNAAKFVLKGSDASVEDWHESLNTNVIGAAKMTDHVSAEMKKTGGGSIVFVGSISSVISQPNFVTYNAAKGAILQMARCYAQDLAPNIRVNCVCPGHTMTPTVMRLAKESGDEERFYDGMKKTTLLGRIADPSEIASAILFLASEEASYITGAHLMVDAGYTTV